MATFDPGQVNEEFTTFKDYLLSSLPCNDKPQRHKSTKMKIITTALKHI